MDTTVAAKQLSVYYFSHPQPECSYPDLALPCLPHNAITCNSNMVQHNKVVLNTTASTSHSRGRGCCVLYDTLYTAGFLCVAT